MTNRLYVNEPVAASTGLTTSAQAEETTQSDAQRPAQFAEGTQPSPKLEPEPASEMIARGSQARLVAQARGSTVRMDAPPPTAPLAEGTASQTPAYRVPPELATKATQIGELWSQEYVRDLRSQHRDIVGGWPGTLREARRRVLAAMPRTLDPQHLEELAKITNLAARKGWESVSEPDLEP